MSPILKWGGLAAALVLAGCASTRIVQQWADPDFAKGKYEKIVVVFQHRDGAFRRPLEDSMAAGIPRAIAAYKIMSDDDVRDEKRAASILRTFGYDTAVIMRLVDVGKEVTYVPGTMHTGPGPYARAWGGWGYGWGAAYDPGYLRTDTLATVSTNVYSLGSEKLVWATRSETMNPNSSVALVEDVVRVNAEAVRKAMGR